MINYNNRINKLMKLQEKKDLIEKGQKRCSKCDIIKELEEFSFNNKSLGRKRSDCKICVRKYLMDKYYDNKKKKTKDNVQNNN